MSTVEDQEDLNIIEDIVEENQDQDQDNNKDNTDSNDVVNDDEKSLQGQEKEQPKEKEQKTNWRLKRINELTGRNKQLEQENAAAKANQETLLAKLAALQSGQQGNPMEAEAEIKRLAAEMAKTIAAQEIVQAQYNRDADRIYNKGIKEFPEFKESIENLNGSFGERWSNAIPLIVDALEDAHKVINHLGNNLDEANRILSMSPARQIAELTKLESILSKPDSKNISNAPSPIKPVSGRASSPISLDDKDDTETWIKKRNKQMEALKSSKKR